MCWITKKTHQKAIAELRKEIGELALDVSGLKYSHDLTLEAYDRCTDELTQIKNELMPPPVDTLQQFDPKVTPYPEELGGMKLGFVKAKQDCFLWGADKDNVLYPYENADWGNNTLARRIQVKATRAAVAINREGTEFHARSASTAVRWLTRSAPTRRSTGRNCGLSLSCILGCRMWRRCDGTIDRWTVVLWGCF
jgi:hypothetical protein